MKFSKASFVIALSFLLLQFSAKAQQAADKSEKPKPAIEWIKSTQYDFGKIPAGKLAVAVFEFTNTGNAPLLIKGTSTSCHCYVAEYTQQPIAPGEKGFVRITYDPKHQTGLFSKTTLVFTNISKERLELTIKGEVVR